MPFLGFIFVFLRLLCNIFFPRGSVPPRVKFFDEYTNPLLGIFAEPDSLAEKRAKAVFTGRPGKTTS